MSNNTVPIKTTKTIYPQIYAYITPTAIENNGWIKIGYTEKRNVEDRIKQQTHTAHITTKLIWSEPAKFKNLDSWFNDKTFHSYLRKYKKIKQRVGTEWFYYDGHPEKSHSDFIDFINNNYNQVREHSHYELRPEQEDAVNTTLNYEKNHKDSKFLWNAKPRFGKTLTTYDFAIKSGAKKVLIVTNRPTIANSWFDDFEKFIAWQNDFAFVSTSDSLKNRPVMSRNEFNKQIDTGKDKMMAFISLQDLKGSISFGGSYDKLRWVKELSWDLLVIDESHEGVDTIKTDVAFDNIKRSFTLYLSGTPFKLLSSGKFSNDQIYNWTYSDEQESKYKYSLNTNDYNPYEKLPRLNLFSYQMSQMITDKINKGADIDGENIDYAFDLNEFFDTNNGEFIHKKEVEKWLDTLSHNDKYPFSTPKLRSELKHTFWLLNRVASAKALEKILKNHPVFENYKIVLAAGDGKYDDDQIVNGNSLSRVKKAIKENDKTITLSVGQLTTGVTVPEWTGVLILSNIKSPSLYMQAAFRAQNPWEYEVNGNIIQKDNAYVFDFAPERTLTIYDDFANNLLQNTSGASNPSSIRKNNIKTLLNFFPVIAEDINGKMSTLDVDQILTIPKLIKSKEVVRKGFMSNLLFQNISGIFASVGAREIIEQLNPAYKEKNISHEIETKNIKVDDDGNANVDPDIIVSTTDASFGEKLYDDMKKATEKNIDDYNKNISKVISDDFKKKTEGNIKKLAKENGLTINFANNILKRNTNAISKDIEVIKKQSDIKRAEAKIEYKKVIKDSKNNEKAINDAKIKYEMENNEIDKTFKNKVIKSMEKNSKILTQKSTETILKKAENNKKNTVEDDVRARLRGFARTIPSFLMAYGNYETTLATFDKIIKDDVFKEVTGIHLNQFISLRDTYNFFDEIVFDESIKEFLKIRYELSNYFDETHDEDIFDYIPPQKTNQIYTPKKVVQQMINELQEENSDIFKDPNRTFADLYVKSGLYIAEIVKKLYIGLKDEIPDNDKRLKHILENQVYGFAPSEIIYNIALNFIFGFDKNAKNIDKSHIVYLDTTPFAFGEGDFESKCDELFGGN